MSLDLILYDPLGPYISLVNNSIGPITSYWLTFINYLYQQIDQLMKNRFNRIEKSRCVCVRCQAISYTLGDIEYIITLV